MRNGGPDPDRRRARCRLAALLLPLLLIACRENAPSAESTTPVPAAPAEAVRTMEDDVLDNIRAQEIGAITLGDLGLPEAFLRRIADRVIRESYQEQFHGAFLDEAYAPPPDELHAPPGDAARIETRHSPRTALTELPQGRPPLAGFRAPLLDAPPWPYEAVDLTEREREARAVVERRLAEDGLALTTLRAMSILENDTSFVQAPGARLKAIGLPVDLLEHLEFDRPGGERGIPGLVEALRGAGDPDAAAGTVAFRFQPTESAFRVATESGEHAIDIYRLQLTRGTHWRGAPHGDSVDVLQQMLALDDDASMLVSIEADHEDDFRRTAVDWSPATWGRLLLIAEPLPVAQWAQDVGKPGWVNAAPAIIAPRLATRREDGVVFVPGESAVVDGLAGNGIRVVHSPLLFQGGNLLPVVDGATGRRVLLIGEAEIHRNRGLGLSVEETQEAFRIEFGADETRVLVTPSFHIDMDLTVRTIGDRTIAFVHDRDAAVRIVLREALDVFLAAGLIDEGDAARSRAVFADAGPLTRAEKEFVIREMGPIVQTLRDPAGRHPISFVKLFSRGANDEPIGNLHRFMVALNEVTAAGLIDAQIPPGHPGRAYFRALRRARECRAELRATLESWGWEVVGIPGWSEATRSLAAVNGLHEAGRFFMAGYGGWCSPVDEAARRALSRAMGAGIEVEVVLCPETQRRSGGLHCAVVAHPQP